MALTPNTMHAGDDLVYDVTVRDATGEPLDLTGATVEAGARESRGATVAGTATITEAAAGVVRVSYADDVLASGLWSVQLRVTIGTETQTVADDEITVKRSAL